MLSIDLTHVCTDACNADRGGIYDSYPFVEPDRFHFDSVECPCNACSAETRRQAKATLAAEAERLAWIETPYRAAVRFDHLQRTFGGSLYEEF